MTKSREMYRGFSHVLFLHVCRASPLSTLLIRMVHVLPRMDLHWYTVVTPSAQFTRGPTLGVVHSVGLGKYLMMYSHYDHLIENLFTALKFLCNLTLHFYPPTSGNHWSFPHPPQKKFCDIIGTQHCDSMWSKSLSKHSWLFKWN